MLRTNNRALALVMLAVVLFSTGPVMVSGADASGITFAFWRLWIGAGLMTVASAALLGPLGRPRPTVTGLRWAAAAGLAFGLHQVFFMTALKATSVADVTLVGTLQPLLVGLAAIPMFGERPGVDFRAWSALAMVGTGVIVVGGASGTSGDPVGMLLAVANIVAFTSYYLVAKKRVGHIDVIPFLAIVMTSSALLTSLCGAILGEPLGSISATDLALALAVACIPGTLGHAALAESLRDLPANIPPLLKLAIPLISTGLAWLFLDQSVSSSHLFGGAVLLVGVAGALWSPGGRRLLVDQPAPDQPDPTPTARTPTP